jgi:gas vesicle protein
VTGASILPGEEAVMTNNDTTQPDAAGGHGPGFMLGLLLGIMAGAAIATLFTPMSGEQVREKTRTSAPDVWRRRDEVSKQARERARSTWDRLRGRREPEGPLDRVRMRLREAWQAGREAAHESEEEARRRFETLTGRRR